MAFRTWAKLLGATLGVGALVGASQLGVAYGLGILRLTRVLDVTTRDQWTAQLAWVAWIAMMAAVLGGLAGGRLRERWRGPATGVTHIALAVAAGVGAALVVPLTMQPARTAQVAGVHPVFVIGLCAGLGTLIGAVAAYAALTELVARWSLTLLGLIVWVIALVSVLPSLAPSDPLPAVRLGVFDAGFLPPAVTQRTALFTMPATALLVGATLGWAARRREMPTLTIALAGLPGPALLTLSYLIAGPGSGADRYQVVPYWAAMTATGAGVLGSVLAAVLRRGEETPEPDGDAAEKAGAAPPVPEPRPAPEPAGPDPRDPPSSTALGDYVRPEPEPFDAFKPAGARAVPPPRSAPDPDPEPYVPAPALRPLPPEAVPKPRGGLLGRARKPFARAKGRGAAPVQREFLPPPPNAGGWPGRGPLVPEPRAVSAPLPDPDPITPPLPVTPAPGPAFTPLEEANESTDQRRDRRRRTEDDFVDWVNGLSADEK
jgi:hypothetical protein